LQNIANNLPDVFADYKCVTKSIYPARNVPERVDVPNKTTQPQIGNKRGINNSKKQEKTENTSKISIDRHLKDKQCHVDICDPQSSPIMGRGYPSLRVMISQIITRSGRTVSVGIMGNN